MSHQQNFTLVIERRARPGADVAFRAWVERFVDAARRSAGHESGSVLSAPCSRSHVILLRFESAAALKNWQRSFTYGQLMQEADRVSTTGEAPQVTGSETNTEGPMNLEHYRQRLLAEQQEASSRLERAVASVSEPSDGVPHDTADESSRGEQRYQQLAQAEAARSLLNQVRDALDRIENGTFGRCAEDGQPIEEARLEAVPWAASCERHNRRRSSTTGEGL